MYSHISHISGMLAAAHGRPNHSCGRRSGVGSSLDSARFWRRSVPARDTRRGRHIGGIAVLSPVLPALPQPFALLAI